MRKATDIAILFFSRSAAHEAALKSWTRNSQTDFRLARVLIERARETLEKSPFPVYHVDETMQQGDCFGCRLANAFQLIFDKGYDHVIAVGNDCAELDVNWQQIADSLRKGRPVLGPDLRGGAYLIGLSKCHEFHAAFDRISWRSRQVFSQLQEYFPAALVLGKKADINTMRDVHIVDVLHEIFIIFSYKPQAGLLKGHVPAALAPTVCCLRAPPARTSY